jgi:hypothetical protein
MRTRPPGRPGGAPWAWLVCLGCFAAVLGLSTVLRRAR